MNPTSHTSRTAGGNGLNANELIVSLIDGSDTKGRVTMFSAYP